jgi:hypothetical protein
VKIKCKKSWLPNGDIVLTVKDHDAPIVGPTDFGKRTNLYGSFWDKPPHKEVLERLVLPRGTPKKEVENAKNSLVLTCEIRMTDI